MGILKKIWRLYSIKIILILALTTLISVTTKIYVISGLFCIIATILVFIYSLKDPSFKSKKIVTKVFIYFFLAILILAGIEAMGGPSSSDTIRSTLFTSSAA